MLFEAQLPLVLCTLRGKLNFHLDSTWPKACSLQKTLAGSGLSLRLGKTYLMHPVNSSFPGQQVPAGGQGYEMEKRECNLLGQKVVVEGRGKADLLTGVKLGLCPLRRE